MKNILVFFGGVSPEHEVSVITGLQIFEHIDRNIYNPIPVLISENGQFFQLDSIKDRRDYSPNSKSPIFFNYDEKERQAYYFSKSSKQYPIYAAFNACHGGSGEAGPLAGLLESFNIPFTSTSTESSIICMNKVLSKQAVQSYNVPTIAGMPVMSSLIRSDVKKVAQNIENTLGLPLIIKPAHLGSSIGIKIVKSSIELELALLEVSHLDNEILIEKFLENISEFNCSVRRVKNIPETSEIERPLLKSEILSFADKYQKGGKKVGGGMASLSREIPANITPEVHKKIGAYALQVYEACKCDGVVRIDFIQSSTGEIFFNEINPIPGSMAFYLWEVLGMPFTKQISDLIEECIYKKQSSESVPYVHRTDIIKNFIAGFKS